MPVLTVNNISKYFVNKKWYRPWEKPVVSHALNGVSFAIGEGEIVGLLGPNGAGKTTTTQILLGTLTPTGGEVHYFGQKFGPQKREILGKINFSSAYIQLPYRMTVWENLVVYAKLYEVKDYKNRIKKLLTEFESWEFRDKMINQLSAGQKTRVLLAKSFINYPRLILLDEPTASLDPDIAVKVRQFLLKQQKQYGVAMLFTSHNMYEVQEICDRIIFLNKGKIIAEDTPSGLIKKMKKTQLRLVVVAKKKELETYLAEKNIDFVWNKGKILVDIKEDDIAKVLYRLSEKGVRYDEIEIVRPNLEDYFLEIVNKNKKQI